MLTSILHEKEHCQVLVLSGVTQGSLTLHGACAEQTPVHEGGRGPPVVLNCPSPHRTSSLPSHAVFLITCFPCYLFILLKYIPNLESKILSFSQLPKLLLPPPTILVKINGFHRVKDISISWKKTGFQPNHSAGPN